MQFIKHFSEIMDEDLGHVGGKGLNLGKLTRAGFAVPNGFCVTTDAYRFSVKEVSKIAKDIALAPALITAIQDAHAQLKTDTVAVRSSATAEDLGDASFAGQQDTFLNVTSDMLLDAVTACWASLWASRAIAYRQTQGITDEGLAMAVVVQEMCPAEISGVLFTVSPFDENVCIIESNWGLGESVVSGEITPDNFQVSRETGEIVKKTIAKKTEMVSALEKHAYGEDSDSVGTLSKRETVPIAKQDMPSLTDAQLKSLAKLGMQVEAFYGQPMDVEWAFADGEFVLLQARPITTQTVREDVHIHPPEVVEKLRQEEIRRLEKRADKHGTVWCHHNIAEVLPAPLPMTWEIIKEFMSGTGGLGIAYRNLGYYPSARVDTMGILELVCGRIYVNLNRETELYFDGYPLAHDFEALKREPQKAMYAQAAPNIRHSTASFWLKLPLHIARMSRTELRLRKQRLNFDRRLKEQVFPQFQATVETAWHIVYPDLSDAEVVAKFQEWRDKTLREFAPQALTATLLAGFSLQRLEAGLAKCLDEAEAKTLTQQLISGLSDNLTVETNEKLGQVARGTLSLDDFLAEAGHRAVGEFELAQPRWREDTDYLEQIIASFKARVKSAPTEDDRIDAHIGYGEGATQQREKAENHLAELLKNKKRLRKQIEEELAFTRRYMPFRETAKFYLMLGYEQIRRALIELDRRYQLNNGIFYLVPDELAPLINGEDFSRIIAERKSKREALLQIEIPDVLFSDSLTEKLSSKATAQTSPTQAYTGTGVSPGIATGPARVLSDPGDVHPTERDYILVCPSTDPAWTPLFLHAAGLVMERGGMLSHGAVVAREYGIPAIANIPNATRNIADGQQLQIDGNRGTVSIVLAPPST
ncbi:hypothetical protein C6495_06920 [Candidatus Poribacteria bacterium]|nr:MAG: hypothetical protein C6495_06920 [Candidatus Poribacteria bacterium]